MNKWFNGDIVWSKTEPLSNREYLCPFCLNKVSSNTGHSFIVKLKDLNGGIDSHGGAIYVCPHCQYPTLLILNFQFPGIPEIKSLDHLPELIKGIYEEARTCMSNNCHTAASMLCRKIIMNTAVSEGAETNLKFFKYVDYLKSKNLFHPKCESLLATIKDKGNEANHEIEDVTKKDAKNVLLFTYYLLLYIYEIPGKINAEILE